MVNIFCCNYINRTLLSAVLSTFTITYSLPLPAQQKAVNFDIIVDAAFLVRLEKKVEKLVKSKDKSIDKMLEHLVDIKNEIEIRNRSNIDVEKYIDRLGQEIKKQYGSAPNKELEIIKKLIRHKDLKAKNRIDYVCDTMNMENYQINTFDENLYYMAKHGRDKDEDNKDEVVLPALLVYGVTCALCGLFLMCLPMPPCKDWGSRMVVAGVTACANSLCSRADENKKDDKKK